MLITKTIKQHRTIGISLGIIVLILVGVAQANHKYLRIECELGGGSQPCCSVLADSAGGSGPPVYDWYELPNNTKGTFDNPTTFANWNGWHCGMWASGKGSLYLDVDDGTLEGHGTTTGSCGEIS